MTDYPTNLDKMLRARGYDNLAERHAFGMGYFDGFYGVPKRDRAKSDTANNWPNAYSAGYWDGYHDRGDAPAPSTATTRDAVRVATPGGSDVWYPYSTESERGHAYSLAQMEARVRDITRRDDSRWTFRHREYRAGNGYMVERCN